MGNTIYNVFHQLRQAQFAYCDSILSLIHFLLLPQLPQKFQFASKVDKIDSEKSSQLPTVSFRDLDRRQRDDYFWVNFDHF